MVWLELYEFSYPLIRAMRLLKYLVPTITRTIVLGLQHKLDRQDDKLPLVFTIDVYQPLILRDLARLCETIEFSNRLTSGLFKYWNQTTDCYFLL